jgi:serine/threonine-protein kinase
MSLPLQDVLKGKYEILEKIGEGGIGAVYKVRHRLLEEIRVIKVLRPEAASKEDLRERFLHEARIAIKLKHPNIAQLHDFSIAEDGRAYIVMEFIDGVALDALVEASGPPSVDLALEISRQGLLALHYLHENNFVHRDVSPDNLMLTSSFDGRPLVKLIDLGIARHLGAEVRLTATGVFLGKARYCSPEQFSAGGEHPTEVDRRGDIYSFGVMLYEILTGVYPLHGNNFAELAGSHLFHPPKDFAETDPDGRLPEGLRQAVLRAMAKAPEDRFATAADFARELESHRNPEAPLRDEFDRTVEIATSAMPRIADRKRPGSTQDRLNLEFGLKTTPPPSTSATDAGGKTVRLEKRKSLTDYVREVEDLVARGRRKPAIRALDRAMADHGTAQPLIELRAAVDQLGAAGTERRRLPLAALLAGAAVVLAGAGVGWWWLGREPAAEVAGARGDEIAAADVGASPRLVPMTPRWDSAAGDAEPAPFLDAIEAPPPTAPETSPTDTSPAEPAGEPPAGQAAQQPPVPAAESATPADGQPAPGTTPTEQPATPPATVEVTQEIFELGVGVVPPVLLELPTPQVPAGARKLREELTVIVKVLVEANGEVSRAAVSEGASFRRNYREAAIAAAKQARFQPAQRDEVIGRMWTEVRVVFEPE